MDERVDELCGRRLRRTGWVTPLRACPVHHGPLELCFDETDFSKWSEAHQPICNHDENRLCWRCDACVGTWLENHFMYRPDIGRPAIERVRRLILACWACGSRRVGHDCVPACCGDHSCRDCGAAFAVSARIIAAGTEPPEEAPVRFWGAAAMSFGGATYPEASAVRSGHRAGFRPCTKCSAPRELFIVGQKTEVEDSTRVAWYCSACDRSETEGSFHRWRNYFEPDAEAACDCPTCGFRGRLVSNDDGAVRCERCRATAEIILAPTNRRGAPRPGG